MWKLTWANWCLTMTKLEFLKHFFERRGFESKASIQSLITIQLEDEDSSGKFKEYEHALYIEGGKFWTILDGNPTVVEGDTKQSFVVMDSRFDFPADFHPVLGGTGLTSTFGLMLFNIVLFWEPFKGLVPYRNKSFTKGFIQDVLADIMVDNPKEGETVPEGKASVDDCLKFSSNASFLQGLGWTYIKPGGVDSITINPAIIKRRDELFAQHKHELNDPVVFTTIVEELVEMDRQEQLKGPSKNFYIADKYISTARKRMFIAFGIEQNPTGDGWVALPNSLAEGIDPNEIVTYVNTAVGGAYSRSMATGEGGSQVKEVLRLIGRSRVVGENCGSPAGEPMVLTKKTAKTWIGGWYMLKRGGTVEQITKANHESLIGKPLIMRVPQCCTQPDGNYCRTCLGAGLGSYENRLSAEVVRVPTEAMLTRMKAHHQAGASSVRFDLNAAIK